MIKFFNKMLRSKFTSDDFNEIEHIKYNNFAKFNEMYLNNELKKGDNLEFDKSLSFEINAEFNKNNIKHLDNISIDELFPNLKYIYQHSDENGTKFIFKTIFNTFNTMLKTNNIDKFSEIIIHLIEIFKIEKNMQYVLSNYLFYDVLESITSIFIKLKKENRQFIAKNIDLLTNFFRTIEEIFLHINMLLDNIIQFLKQPNSQHKILKFNSFISRLKKILKFITTIIKFNNVKDFHILNDIVNSLNSKIKTRPFCSDSSHPSRPISATACSSMT